MGRHCIAILVLPTFMCLPGVHPKKDIKYYIAQNFQSCDSFCQSVGKVCAAEDHGFDTPQNVTSIFLQLGILCKLSSSSDYKLLTHPRIKTTGKPPGLCSGINKVPRRIDCHSAPTAVYAHRLCPCYEESICKQVKFNPAVSGKALKGHTLETYKVGLDEVCQLRCAAHDLCTSYNLGPRNRGWHDCEISKSDAIRHPNDLTTHSGYIYREIVNPCSQSPCQQNHVCVPLLAIGPSQYECICVKGWKGDGCSQDIDECDTINGTYNCDYYASCTNSEGSFQCACKQGFTGDGKLCFDVNECEPNSGRHDCDEKALCINTAGSFNCKCKAGYSGNGKQCSDINECNGSPGSTNCHKHAVCTNTAGSYKCACKAGFSGNGITCTDNDECAAKSDNCHVKATCTNTVGSFECKCGEAYTGDGVTSCILGYSHKGCFKDGRTRALPEHLSNFPQSELIVKCYQAAKAKGYKAFGCQYRTQCFSGPDAHNSYNKLGEATNCQDGTGGVWANDIYFII